MQITITGKNIENFKVNPLQSKLELVFGMFTTLKLKVQAVHKWKSGAAAK